MRFASALVGLAAAGLILAAGQARALVIDTIDFESVGTSATTVIGSSFVEDGYRLDATAPSELRVLGAGTPQFTGSAAMQNTDNGGRTTLSRVDGNPFSLLSIDLAEFNAGNATVEFTGFQSGGAEVSASFTLDGNAFGLETFLFSGFVGLDRVEWDHDSPFHQFDNIVVAAPVPAVLPVAAIGFGALFLMSVRARRGYPA